MTTLLRASCLILGYELIKQQVVEQVKQFYGLSVPLLDYEGEQPYVPSPEQVEEYKREVTSRYPQSTFRASCSWLIEQDALTEEQVDDLDRIRSHRNAVTHELLRFLFDPEAEVDVEVLEDAHGAIRDLGRFWGTIAAGGDPAFDGTGLDTSSVTSGAFLAYDHVLSLAAISTDSLGAVLARMAEESDQEARRPPSPEPATTQEA